MLEAQTSFQNSLEEAMYVRSSESLFNDYVFKTIDFILNNPKKNIILLAGPTCSGKSTFSKRLRDMIIEHGQKCTIISIDNFFLDRKDLNEKAIQNGGVLDYDSIAATDTEFLQNTITQVLAGGKVQTPMYDFVTGSRTGIKNYTLYPKEYVIFEGIQVVYPEIMSRFPVEKTFSIFVDTFQPISTQQYLVSPRDLRLLRRIARNCTFRHDTFSFVLSNWNNVVDNEDKNIYPYSKSCMIEIDTSVPYELNILKPIIMKLVEENPRVVSKFPSFKKLLKCFDGVPAFSSSYLQKDSFYHEFVK